MQTISTELQSGDPGGLPSFVAGLPWLLVRFKAALKRILAADSADGNQRGQDQKRSAVPVEFAFFMLLLQPLLGPIEAASQVLSEVSYCLLFCPEMACREPVQTQCTLLI